jgi:hypothetical protein
MKKQALIWIFGAAVIIGAAGCKANKKNRCNTCPKWEDSRETIDRP